MGNYNFEDNNYEFDETVRLDDINKEIREVGEFEETVDFEPVKNSRRPLKGKQTPPQSIFSDRVVKLSIIGGVVVFVFMFIMVFMTTFDKRPEPEILAESGTEQSELMGNIQKMKGVILSTDKNETLQVYGIEYENSVTVKIADDAVLLGNNGGKIHFAEYKAGDVIELAFNDSNLVKEIQIPKDVWRIDSVSGVLVDMDTKKVTYQEKNYGLYEKSFFLDGEKVMFGGDVSLADTVTLIGKGNEIYSLRIEVGHGLVMFRNLDTVEEIQVLIDDKPIVIDEEKGIAEIGAGIHKMTISGSTLSEDYITVVTVESQAKLIIDLAEVLEGIEEGIVYLKVDQNGYNVYIDGILYEGNGAELVMEKGTHKIEVKKAGYQDWSTNITVGDRAETLDVTLKPLNGNGGASVETKKGNLTINSEPGWAKIYVDGNYIGVSPVMVSVEYGEHTIEAELEGYKDYKGHTTVESPEKTVKVKLN